jgi:radical SAM superfamily enzyme YgiQ (UPF0313 family)
MSAIVLATLNAKYPHCAFGLRYLLANMGDLREETELLEFTINQQTLDIVDAILARQPKVVGLGVYIWNVEQTTRLVADLKRVAPDVIVVLGGPEVSYETELLPVTQLADYVITGEADLAFATLCRELLASGEGSSLARDGEIVSARIIHAPVPVLTHLKLPYDLYRNEDIAQRVLYVEASRGCPFTCEFCLSALDIPVRQFPLDEFLSAMGKLLDRGARQFKFVDRTFNLNLRVSRAILDFFLQRYQPGMFLHFELIPDRLPDSLQELIVRFPAGALQFEVGIQTFNSEVSDLISRQQDNDLVDQNLTWLSTHTQVHVHADLIVGLPGESLDSFGAGFDRLVRLKPHEIQVGILKRLRGTPIIRHDAEWQMVYSPHAPYEILSTKLLDFRTIQELRRFARTWDMVANSGNFVETIELWWEAPVAGDDAELSPFTEFRRFTAWLSANEGLTQGISLGRLVERVFEYLTTKRGIPSQRVADILWRDYQRGGRSDKPHCLRPFIGATPLKSPAASKSESIPKRQARRQPDSSGQ